VIASTGDARRVENRLVVRPFGISDKRYIVAAQVKDLRGNADAFGGGRPGASIDLDPIGRMTEWGSSALR
jgi:hypothetical protein